MRAEIRCPNCDGIMTAGDPCPECDHVDGYVGCECQACLAEEARLKDEDIPDA